MAFVAGAEILQHVFGPLIGLGEQHAVLVAHVEFATQALEDIVGFGQVLVAGAFALDQIGNGVEPQRVDPEIEPEPHDPDDRLEYLRIIEIQIRLMRIKAVPVIGLRHRVPAPVRSLGVGKDDARFRKFLVGVAPHVIIAKGRSGFGAAGALEPWMLVRGVIDHQFGNDAQIAAMRFPNEDFEIRHSAVSGIDVLVLGNVIPVVAQRRRVKWQQPQRGDAEILQIVQFAAQPLEVADAVVIGIEKRLNMQLINNRVLVPQRVQGLRTRQRAAAGER